jgi:hypothetical protein
MSVLNQNGGKGADGSQAPLTLEQVMAEVNKNLETRLSVKFDEFKKTGLGDAIKTQLDPLKASLTTINEALSKLTSGGGGVTPPAGGSGGTGGDGGRSPEVNAQLRTLTDTVKAQGGTIAQLQADKEKAERRAEETDRHSVIRTALNGLPFVNEKAADTAFSIVSPHVRRLDDGALVAESNGENFPVQAFTKDFLEKEHGYLFKASGASGSGASSSTATTHFGAKADTNMIKVGMKAEDRASVVESIAAALAPQ